MPRPKLIISTCFPYHVRSRSNNREWFFVPKSETWSISMTQLQRTVERYQIEVQCFVLMDNHYHLLVKTPEGNLAESMQYFNREMSKAIGKASGRINRIFGGRYQRSLVTEESYLRNVFKYVVRNPVVSGLCQQVEDYTYSTLCWDFGATPQCDYFSPLKAYASAFPRSRTELMIWLNTPYSSKEAQLVRFGLRRGTFKWSQSNDLKSTITTIAKLPGM